MTSTDEALRRRKYRNPPIVEAVARISWSEPIGWNVTTPGRLFERLSSDYPEEPRTQLNVQATFAPGAPAGPAALTTRPSEKLLFAGQDGSRLLGVAPTEVSAHGLAPYEGWEALEERLFGGLDAVTDVVSPSAFTTIGLRYINRLEIPETPIRFEDYLTISLSLPQGFPSEVHGFFDRTESTYPDSPTSIALTWASVEAPPGTSCFVLDLDLVFQPEHPLSVEEAREALRSLKAKEGTAFESLLQERSRELFGEVQD